MGAVPRRGVGSPLPAAETRRRRVEERLELLYRDYAADVAGVAKYYASDRGYYPPEDREPGGDPFAIALATTDGEVFQAGDHDRPFALQSLSKVFVYGLALEDRGRDEVLERVGVEPSGDAFNSIEFDERNHRPYNPMVNAGALVTTDLVRGGSEDEKWERILAALRRCAANERLDLDEAVFQKELEGADRNRATAYLMRSQGMLAGNVERLLALYLRQCSVHVTARDLAVMGATLSNGCENPLTGESVFSKRSGRDVLSVMHTCGMYDFAGQWAYEVGVPAKSGVSGGIVAAIPGKGGIGVFSPGLDVYGNSVRGVRVCEEISGRLGLHVFATEDEDALLRARSETTEGARGRPRHD